MAEASVGQLFSLADKLHYLVPLLKDELKAVRIEAAHVLVDVELATKNVKHFTEAFKELMSAYQLNSWRGECRANLALVNIRQQDWLSAEHNYRQAITIDPYFESGYINLAEFYRQALQDKQLADVLELALKETSSNVRRSLCVWITFGQGQAACSGGQCV